MENNKATEFLQEITNNFINNIVSQLADEANKNGNKSIDKLTESFSVESKEDTTTEEELTLYRSLPIQKVESSNIEGLTYLPESKILKIRFTGGGEYIYKNVEELQYKNIMNAKSIGKYFNDNIKAFPNKYTFVRI